MNPHLYNSWSKYVYNLDYVLDELEKQTIISVGVAPFQRIIPSLFMSRNNYQVYSVKSSQDLSVLRKYGTIFSLEERNPKFAQKVQSTGYLLGSHIFQGFINNRPVKPKLLFYQTNNKIVEKLEQNNFEWIGNHPDTFNKILHKEGFRSVLKQLRLNHLADWDIPKSQLLTKSFDDLYKRWNRSVVVQPGDYEISGGNFFVHSQADMDRCIASISQDPKFNLVNVFKLSPFVIGDTVSMLGCVTDKGVLTSGLQLQLIDVPESLHGYPSGGTFFGHDWGYKSWSSGAEIDAQVTVEVFGGWLAKHGYRGIFGIDFIYDTKKDELYPLECNPRFTGAIPVYSMLNLVNKVPPIDFFTLTSYLSINVEFDFNAVNELWKKPVNAAHIAFTPQGISSMPLNLQAGIYSIERDQSLRYQRPGAFLHELRSKNEIIVIDQVPFEGQVVMQNVPRLFKFIMPFSIAKNSNTITKDFGEIIDRFQSYLRPGDLTYQQIYDKIN